MSDDVPLGFQGRTALTGVAVPRNHVYGSDENLVVAGPPAFTGVAVRRNHVSPGEVKSPADEEAAEETTKNEGKSPADEWREVEVGDDGEWQDVDSGEESPGVWDGPPGSLPMVLSYSLDLPKNKAKLRKFNKEVEGLVMRITGVHGPPAKKAKTDGAAGGGADKI